MLIAAVTLFCLAFANTFIGGRRIFQYAFITTHEVKRGFSNLTTSPACFPGIKNNRTERALDVYLRDNAATSISIFSITCFVVLPGIGTTSNPVPETDENKRSSCTVYF